MVAVPSASDAVGDVQVTVADDDPVLAVTTRVEGQPEMIGGFWSVTRNCKQIFQC